MKYQAHNNGYVFWQDVLILPIKKRRPTDGRAYFRKEISFEEVEKYWEYTCEDGIWKVYYNIRDKNRRLAYVDCCKHTPEAIECMIHDKDISVSDCKRIEEAHPRVIGPRTELSPVIWSKEFNGKSVVALLLIKPKMTYNEILNVIQNEKGTVDANGIIHKEV